MLDEALDTEAMDDEDAGGAKNQNAKAARMLVKAIWQVEWSASNPDATSEQRRTAWKGISASDRTDRAKLAKKALRLMAKRGVTFSVSPAGDDKGGDDEDAE